MQTFEVGLANLPYQTSVVLLSATCPIGLQIPPEKVGLGWIWRVEVPSLEAYGWCGLPLAATGCHSAILLASALRSPLAENRLSANRSLQ